MKKNRFFLSIAFIAILFLTANFVLTSCNKEKFGGWAPVKTDRSQIDFPTTGGSATVTTNNYSSWWVDGVQEKTGSNSFQNVVVLPTNGKITGDWYEIEIPAKPGNQVIITASPNTTKESRELQIGMSVGDTGTMIKVTQQAQP